MLGGELPLHWPPRKRESTVVCGASVKQSKFANVRAVVRHRMSRIRKVDTRPELIVRTLVTRLGYRYRLHKRSLPGTPDLVFAKRRRVIFVHGCFWHQHDCTLGNKQPVTRRQYWLPKLRSNVERDLASRNTLQEAGWKVLVIWECEITDEASLAVKLRRFLGGLEHSRS
jgi:DNA mismatch endonuclease (patch repair protein)